VSIEIVDCEQGTPEWYAARCGIPTASCFQDIVTGGKGKTRQNYLYQLAGEILSGEPDDYGYTNAHMERGKEFEAQARAAYEVIADVETTPVGFVRNSMLIPGRVLGCSPDAFIGTNGTLEIKTRLRRLQVELLLSGGDVPREHVAQCQGAIWVCEREFADFFAWAPGLPSFLKRVYRDDPYLAYLKVAVEEFFNELDSVCQRLRT
jgi:YqaJ-like viral recombinase domain